MEKKLSDTGVLLILNGTKQNNLKQLFNENSFFIESSMASPSQGMDIRMNEHNVPMEPWKEKTIKIAVTIRLLSEQQIYCHIEEIFMFYTDTIKS